MVLYQIGQGLPYDSSRSQPVRIYSFNPYRLFEGPKLDMANLFSNTANLILAAIFFHPLFPLSIPIALVGLLVNYWTNKVHSLCLINVNIDSVSSQNAHSRVDVLNDGLILLEPYPLLCVSMVSWSSPLLSDSQ